MHDLSLREHCELRLKSMQDVRQDYEREWEQIARFAQPARSRFLSTGRKDKGDVRRSWNGTLKDSHGIEAFRTLANGMTSGLSSPSRPWFSLRLRDEELNEQPGVREYLADVEQRMYAFLSATNFYGASKAGYAELGLFGTEACVMIEHPVDGAVCHTLTAGEYWISLSDAMRPDTLARECWMTARQIVQSFGREAPRHVLQAFDKADHERSMRVWNMIEPNPGHDEGLFGSKAWRSVYWCDMGQDREVLAVRGYDEQPFWAPRWDVVGGDTYGISPGMECLPALRELQMQAKRRNEAIDGMVKPEKIVPPGIRLTGEPGRNVSGSIGDKQIVIPYQMPYQAVAAIGEEIMKCRQQIDSLSFAELFTTITNMQGIQPRNVEEIAARNEEKFTLLGPVIDRVGKEKLEIIIDRTFGIMNRGGLLPQVPEALSEMQIDVEFVSILSQMQRAVGAGMIERAASFAGNVAGVSPDVLDNFDFDEMARDYGERVGLPANTMRPAKDVEAVRAQRAQEAQMAKAAEMMPAMREGVEAAHLLSQTDVGGVPALDTLIGA